jgi:hypothetical protein
LTWLPYLSKAALPIAFGEWLACCLVAGAYASALGGLTPAIARILPAAVAAGLVVVTSALWLTWPIWMAPHFQGESSKSVVAALVAPHPLFAMDGVLLRSAGTPWALSPLAYKWCVALHLLIAGGCVGLDVLVNRRQRVELLAAPAA